VRWAVADEDACQLIRDKESRDAGYPTPSVQSTPGYHAQRNPIPGEPPGWTAHIHYVRQNASDPSERAYPVSDDEQERADLVEAILEDPAIPPGQARAAAIQAINDSHPSLGPEWEPA